MSKITFEVTDEEIKKYLIKLIKSPNAELIAKTIVNHVQESELGLEDLYKSMLGLERTFKYNTLDTVWVRFGHLATWRYDKEKMKEQGLIVKDEYVKCTIVEIYPFKKCCYVLKYNCAKSSDSEITTDTYNVPEDLISGIVNEEDDILPLL